MFRNLIEKSKRFHLKKQNSKIIFFLIAPLNLFLSKNVFITYVPQINTLHKLLFYVCYEKAYQHKKFQKFNIKIVITMTCSNHKNGKKMSQRILGINL